MNDNIKSDTQSKGASQQPSASNKQKSGLGQKIWRCFLGLALLGALAIALLTMRVNSQRAAIKGIMDADGDVSYRIERDANGRRIPPDELGKTLRGAIGNMFGIDFVSDVNRINLGSTSGIINGILRSNDRDSNGSLDQEEQKTLSESAKRFVAMIDSDIEDGITKEELAQAGEKLMAQNLDAIENQFTGLTHLAIDQNNIPDLTFVSGLKDLRFLTITENPISDLTPLSSLENLERVILNKTEVKDLSPIQNLASINRLELANTPITDLTPIEGLQNIHTLRIEFTEVESLESVGKLTGLAKLNIQKTKVTDLTPIGNLPNLQDLDMEDTKITDVSPLAGAKSLKAVTNGRTNVSKESIAAVKAALPDVIFGTKARPTSSFR